jgi:hypothetical protein
MGEHAGRGSWPRSAAVVAAMTAALMLLLSWLWPDLTAVAAGDLARDSLEVALSRVAAVAAALCAGWWWLVTCATAVSAAGGTSPARPRGCPAWWHRAVLGACGVAVASALAAPAYAAGEAELSGQPERGVAVVQGLPLPDRPLGSLARSGPPAEPSPGPASSTADTVTVAAGDSLWSLAKQRLPVGATDAEVDAAWRRLYAANRAAIGPDPDLIRPGLRLRVPGARR